MGLVEDGRREVRSGDGIVREGFEDARRWAWLSL